MWLCKQCLEQIPEREKLTHEDFHLAMEMSKEPGALQARVQVFIQTHMLRLQVNWCLGQTAKSA